MAARLSTGIAGLDEILLGGLVPGLSYLVEGGPGTGKTMLGLHYLTEGAEHGERSLFVSLEHPASEIRNGLEGLPFALDDIDILDLSPSPEAFVSSESVYGAIRPAEVEFAPLTQAIVARVRETQPVRIFLDGVNLLRNLSPNEYHFRRQIVSMVHFLSDNGATPMLSCEDGDESRAIKYMSSAIVSLDGAACRSLRVVKYFGSGYREGVHGLKLSGAGVEVFPRLVPSEFGRPFVSEQIRTGIQRFDQLLGGGIERGTVNIVSGPSGCGKTTVTLQFLMGAAQRGDRSILYAFEEEPELLIMRAEGVGFPLQSFVDQGLIVVEHIEPLLYSVDEFAARVRHQVETRGVQNVAIDSLAGYRVALRGGDIVEHLHAVAKYLQRQGVTTFLLNEVERVTGDFRVTEIGVSFIADNIIILRYIEFGGELRKTIGVLKKRASDFEPTLREFAITSAGIRVGEPLSELRGILTGTPKIGLQHAERLPV